MLVRLPGRCTPRTSAQGSPSSALAPHVLSHLAPPRRMHHVSTQRYILKNSLGVTLTGEQKLFARVLAGSRPGSWGCLVLGGVLTAPAISLPWETMGALL